MKITIKQCGFTFGQTQPVTVYRVLGETEKNILDTIERKSKQKQRMGEQMKIASSRPLHDREHYALNFTILHRHRSGETSNDKFTLYNRRGVEICAQLPDVHFDLLALSPIYSRSAIAKTR